MAKTIKKDWGNGYITWPCDHWPTAHVFVQFPGQGEVFKKFTVGPLNSHDATQVKNCIFPLED